MSGLEKSETSANLPIARREYTPPTLEPLGSWRAVTLGTPVTVIASVEKGHLPDPRRFT